MAIDTIAGFKISFPELIDSRTGPFSSYEDAINFTNQNFRVIGQKVIVVNNAAYRNLDSSSPTIISSSSSSSSEMEFGMTLSREDSSYKVFEWSYSCGFCF